MIARSRFLDREKIPMFGLCHGTSILPKAPVLGRRLETVIMPQSAKDDLVAKLEDFFSEEAKTDYARCGIPHKIAILLHGPPGTGKTSLIYALAQQFKLSLLRIPCEDLKQEVMEACLQMNTQPLTLGRPDIRATAGGAASDEWTRSDVANKTARTATTTTLFRSGIIIEDVDSLFDKTENNDTSAICDEYSGGAAAYHAHSMIASNPMFAMQNIYGRQRHMAGDISFSSFINLVDGVRSVSDTVIFITSNHLELLDDALLRPGRIDRIEKKR